ncbi:DUF397 domain-containing protein [Actinomadura harenae]|uniref:DUF397 domain-containing protein n=1 Tax=Actinomadura harenae TaxID=2483351 RepID=A0A3M2MEF9_9ACTN|nr:DUF397 domain-containing protein [Actinomadura harenae]RMI47390.1 DUF397 domain-containing protein [Actinomadura harenae]
MGHVIISGWTRSSYSGDSLNCIEVTQDAWRRSSHSAEGANCVEVAGAAGSKGLAVRDSKDPGGPVLSVDVESFRGLLGQVRLR